MSSVRARRGFTLVELLVVIAIIGVLVALLLPAVQMAREAANRSSCSNNLKQLALAIQTYHDTHRSFPPGAQALNSIQANSEADGQWYDGMMGWPVFVLPFLEQRALHDQIDTTRLAWTSNQGDPYFNNFSENGDVINRPAAQSMPSGFTCPSSPRIGPSNEFKDYAMNSGGTALSQCCPERATTADGIGHKNSRVRIADVLDGTSNTFAFLEQSNFHRASDMMGRPSNPFFWVNHSSNGLAISHQGTIDFPPNHIQTTLSGRTSRSDHPAGLQAASVDGSVRFIPETIGRDPWRWLHSRMDMQVIPAF